MELPHAHIHPRQRILGAEQVIGGGVCKIALLLAGRWQPTGFPLHRHLEPGSF